MWQDINHPHKMPFGQSFGKANLLVESSVKSSPLTVQLWRNWFVKLVDSLIRMGSFERHRPISLSPPTLEVKNLASGVICQNGFHNRADKCGCRVCLRLHYSRYRTGLVLHKYTHFWDIHTPLLPNFNIARADAQRARRKAARFHNRSAGIYNYKLDNTLH